MARLTFVCKLCIKGLRERKREKKERKGEREREEDRISIKLLGTD
jgi:hypothetical protein